MAGQTVSMKEPVCLIENDSDGKLRVVRSALDILDQIDQHVVVVSVVGLYRTGKSYLMNKLAGEKKGFALGATIQSKTKGIWMWCVPHPEKRDHTLVLLDTEGLGDVEKGDEKNDNWIFSLAVLLSSTLVYNSLGTIDNNALEKLHYVTELTEHIKVKSNQRDGEESSEYLRYFPSFVWTVRDFTLTLEVEPSGYKKDQAYNLPRSCLRNYFSPRWCFVFERPASGDKMRRMEELTDADLEPAFVEQAKEFCDHVFMEAKTKTLKQGLKVTGRLLGNLAETYVSAIRSGQIPCLDNAVLALAQIENSSAIERARAHYQKGMADWVAYPTETQEELSEVHAVMEKEAVAIFINNSFKDEDQKYQLELMYEKICERNYKESQKACESKIECIFDLLEVRIRDGSYMTSGGYKEYLSCFVDAVQRSYECTDVMLKVKYYVWWFKAEEITDTMKMHSMTWQQHSNDHQMEQRTYEENVNQLMERMSRDSRNAVAEHDRVLQARLKEQNDLLQQGFDDRAHQMQREIDALFPRFRVLLVVWGSKYSCRDL
uniref:Guanylate binding protein 2 n=1 Tax=Hucho hucho TaxID=62062 RepID=A0A4W5NPW9_9TELE